MMRTDYVTLESATYDWKQVFEGNKSPLKGRRLCTSGAEKSVKLTQTTDQP
jgi:hypothetical protein